MSSTFTVRIDDQTAQELEILAGHGRSRNAVVSAAIHAAYRELVLEQVRRETAALAADPDDLAEVARVQADLDELRAW